MNWPETPTAAPIGDGRYASHLDQPSTVDELRQTLTRRIEEGYAIYPRGGATALEFGGIPRSAGVAISTTGLNRVIDYPAADMTITVEAGITVGELQAILAAENQRLTIDVPHPDKATVGGLYATNTYGPRRYGNGRPRDQIIGIGFVNAEGNLIKGGGRVVKNVAGYDLPKLITGSLGTLGIIAELTLKVRPKPETSALAWVTFDKFADAQSALGRLNTSDTRPTAIELLNRHASDSIGTHLGLPAAEWVVVVGIEDNPSSVEWQLQRLSGEMAPRPMEVRRDGEAERLWSNLTEVADWHLGPMMIQVMLPPTEAVKFLDRLSQKNWAVHAHAGNGFILAQWIGEPSLNDASSKVHRLREEVLNHGGSLTVPRCPTDWKPTLKVWGDPRGDWVISERIKATMDPRGVLNPGRFIGTI